MPVRLDARTVAREIALGYLTGTAGTAAMTTTTALEKRLRSTQDLPVDYDATDHVVDAASTVLGYRPRSEAGARALFLLTHWGYGSAMAIAHRLLVRRLGRPGAAGAFFAGVQTMAFVLFPVAGDTPPPSRWRRDVLASSVAQHLVYAVAVAEVDRRLTQTGRR
ncbi:hypothetical protein D9V37_02300 [Nocardioides mangrovicus]|uniref:DUF1440 domain-containing protein n=1 Tax=Nocardioides mangrovicus TaxID=2478913 RepID=A0A3L8P8J0_9ACTN|nr:hypothetical protein [Nocardioides mangrovicus]RLV50808.1 hypothetical protein D9V37_02300 [Nocardioides mangrovicus]